MLGQRTPHEVHEMLKDAGVILIDVREAEEFANAHIAGAFSLPLSGLYETFDQLHIAEGDKIILHCFKGPRVDQAYDILTQKFNCPQEIYNMTGGIAAWAAEKLPLVTLRP